LTLFSFLTLLSPRNIVIERLKIAAWFLLPLVFLYTGARSALIALPFIAFGLFIFRKGIDFKKPFLAFLIGGLCCTILASTTTLRVYSLKPTNIESLTHVDDVLHGKQIDNVAKDVEYKGDSNRLRILHHVFGMIKDKPILGSGLGSILLTQERDYGQFIDLMDCTALWLWAETGIFGLALFLTFYFLCFRALWIASKDEKAPPLTRDLSKGALLMLVIFGVMSLFHELLYSRFLWLFLGMMLALPRTQNQET